MQVYLCEYADGTNHDDSGTHRRYVEQKLMLATLGLGKRKGERTAWVRSGCPMEGEKLIELREYLAGLSLSNHVD